MDTFSTSGTGRPESGRGTPRLECDRRCVDVAVGSTLAVSDCSKRQRGDMTLNRDMMRVAQSKSSVVTAKTISRNSSSTVKKRISAADELA